MTISSIGNTITGQINQYNIQVSKNEIIRD